MHLQQSNLGETLQAEFTPNGTQFLVRWGTDLEEQLHGDLLDYFGTRGEIVNQHIERDSLDSDHLVHEQQDGSCFGRAVVVHHVVVLFQQVQEVQPEIILLLGQTLYN